MSIYVFFKCIKILLNCSIVTMTTLIADIPQFDLYELK